MLYNKKLLQTIANAPVVPIINKSQFEKFEIDGMTLPEAINTVINEAEKEYGKQFGDIQKFFELEQEIEEKAEIKNEVNDEIIVDLDY